MSPVASTSIVDTVPISKKARSASTTNQADRKHRSTTSTSTKLSTATPPLGKFLASSEKHIRDKAVASLTRFLSAGQVKTNSSNTLEADGQLPVGDLNWDEPTKVDKRLAPVEMAKLWKGIFYCFWMSDKPLVQQALANDLATLTLDVRPKKSTKVDSSPPGRVERFRAAMTYLRGFWEATVREWTGLDKWRLDKFYLLIRRFVHVGFLLLQREQWDPRAVAEYNEMLVGPGGPLEVANDRLPASIVYHFSDIALTELERVFAPSTVPEQPLTSTATTKPPATSSASPSSSPLPLLQVLDPFTTILALAPSKAHFARVVEHVFDPLLADGLPSPSQSLGSVGGGHKKRKATVARLDQPSFEGIWTASTAGAQDKGQAAVGVLRHVFEVAGRQSTSEVNRRRMYELVKKWEGERAVEI